MNEQMRHDQAKLDWEIDPSDLHEALKAGGHAIVVDARKPEAYARGRE